MSWQEMTARERDAWLAEKAMGWHHHSHLGMMVWCEVNVDGRCLMHAHDEERAAGLIVLDAGGEHIIFGFKPTTYLAAAMGLAERMRERGYFLRIIMRQVGHQSEHGYYCGIEGRRFNVDGQLLTAAVNADTLPVAIAEACYRALGGE